MIGDAKHIEIHPRSVALGFILGLVLVGLSWFVYYINEVYAEKYNVRKETIGLMRTYLEKNTCIPNKPKTISIGSQSNEPAIIIHCQ